MQPKGMFRERLVAESGFNLLQEKWLPVRRASGARERVAPAGIVSGPVADPVVAFDWGRADFDAASVEFMVGLLACACPPADDRDWHGWWASPPAEDDLAARFDPLAEAFALTGEGPLFMQDLEEIGGMGVSVSGLMIEAPGANAERNNGDLFQKRGRFPALSLPAAAMALFTLQTYAPAGGAGHRTSLRGGGPLTTLALPPPEKPSLWHLLWLNLENAAADLPALTAQTAPDLMPRIFPWLAPTKTSEGNKPPLGEADIDPRGVYWGMPRRIRLDITHAPQPETCAATGERVHDVVCSYRTRPWGMNYATLRHPLSPMYRQNATSTEWLYVHPQPGGLTYRHWIDLALTPEGTDYLRRPAPALHGARARLQILRVDGARIRAVGYDMDKMKARGFVEAQFPLFVLGEQDANKALDRAAREFVAAAGLVNGGLLRNLRQALQIEKTDAARIDAVARAFQDRTQEAFFAALHQIAEKLAVDAYDDTVIAEAGRAFLRGALAPVAQDLFDSHAPLSLQTGRLADMGRVVAARRNLLWILRGTGKDGAKLFAHLGLPQPQAKAREKSAGKSKSAGKNKSGKEAALASA